MKKKKKLTEAQKDKIFKKYLEAKLKDDYKKSYKYLMQFYEIT